MSINDRNILYLNDKVASLQRQLTELINVISGHLDDVSIHSELSTAKTDTNVWSGKKIDRLVDKMIYFITKNSDEISDSKVRSDLLRNLTDDNMRALLTLIDVFSLRFNSGIKDGEGASVWFDDREKIHLEVDTIRVREKLTTKYDELQALKCSNGTLVISQSGKIKSIKGD